MAGIEEKLTLPPAFEGNVYDAQQISLIPNTLEHANNSFSNSSFCKKAFGDDVVFHYSTFFNHEIDLFNRNVTNWELSRYFVKKIKKKKKKNFA